MKPPCPAWLALALAACGGSAPAPAPPAHPPPTLADMTDAMCACKTPACADGVKRDYAAVVPPTAAGQPPHTAALLAYATKCEATAREAEELARLKAMRDAMCACKDSTCALDVDARYRDFMVQLGEKYRGGVKPPDDLMDVGIAISRCESDAATGSASSPSAGGTGLDDGGSVAEATGVPACDAYLRAFDRYLACDKVPSEAKDASREGIRQMKDGWKMLRDPSVSAGARKAAADACQQGTAALRQSAAALGCPM